MNVKLLIDGIVRQTSVLIAQLSTTAGCRAPLSRFTDDIFLGLARELESQGVKKRVVADMFGIALRSYQKKMQRLTEGVTQRDRSLWEAILEFVTEEHPTRSRVLERFNFDGEKEVIAVLTDLVGSGMIFVTGSGRSAVYGPTQDEYRTAVIREHDQESVENWIWLMVFRGELKRQQDAQPLLGLDQSLVDAAFQRLFDGGQLREENGRLHSSNLVVPVAANHGMETAVLDHFRTVCVAIAKKLTTSSTSSETDETGGTTLTFTVEPGHPFEQEVRTLLKVTRRQAQALWAEVARHNDEHPPTSPQAIRVSFYCGQLIEDFEDRNESTSSDCAAPTL